LSLTELGWNEHFEQHRPEGELVLGRVAVEHRGAYAVYADDGEAWAELAGKLRYEAAGRGELPAVGDWVAMQLRPEGRATIHAVLPRRTKISRKVNLGETEEQVLAANIDTIFLVSSLNRDLNVRRIERYLATAWESGAEPAIVLNKADLCPVEERADLIAEIEAVAFGVPVHTVSAVTREGLDELTPYFGPGRTVVLLGSSGVGKSTLINSVLGTEQLETREIREGDGRGRHTTTHRELIVVPGGGLVIDTPGLRELQLWGEADGGVGEAFQDVTALAATCRFHDCAHETEPGCAVRAAIGSGALPAERLESYRKLQRELARLERRRDGRLQSLERQKWRKFSKQQRQNPKTRRR
jgi:ribosome biogenesis GTPase / thiamine phosphate phosphatase